MPARLLRCGLQRHLRGMCEWNLQRRLNWCMRMRNRVGRSGLRQLCRWLLWCQLRGHVQCVCEWRVHDWRQRYLHLCAWVGRADL